MAITPWVKKHGLTEAHNARNEIDQLIDGLFSNSWAIPFGGSRKLQDKQVPRSDISETKHNYEISMELPGIKEADIDITVDGNVLTVKAEKKHEEKKDEKNYHYSERSYGSFERSVRLPESTKMDAISASFENGVLEIEIPKKSVTESKSKKIKVSKKAK